MIFIVFFALFFACGEAARAHLRAGVGSGDSAGVATPFGHSSLLGKRAAEAMTRRKRQTGNPLTISMDFRGVDELYRPYFLAAARVWMNVLDTCLAGPCRVHVSCRVIEIDGEGGILASSGPDDVDRYDGIAYTNLGSLDVDMNDIDLLYREETLESTLFHEFGQILGFGTLWQMNNLVSPTNENRVPTTYTAVNAAIGWQREFNQLGQPPLERSGGAGIAGAHWDQPNDAVSQSGITSKIFGRDLIFESMTAFANEPSYLSSMTLGAMEDLGYVVNNLLDTTIITSRNLPAAVLDQPLEYFLTVHNSASVTSNVVLVIDAPAVTSIVEVSSECTGLLDGRCSLGNIASGQTVTVTVTVTASVNAPTRFATEVNGVETDFTRPHVTFLTRVEACRQPLDSQKNLLELRKDEAREDGNAARVARLNERIDSLKVQIAECRADLGGAAADDDDDDIDDNEVGVNDDDDNISVSEGCNELYMERLVLKAAKNEADSRSADDEARSRIKAELQAAKRSYDALLCDNVATSIDCTDLRARRDHLKRAKAKADDRSDDEKRERVNAILSAVRDLIQENC